MKKALALVPALLVACAPFETDAELADRYHHSALEILGTTGGDPEKARALLDEAIELDSDRPDFYLARAGADRALHLSQDAETDTSAAIDLIKRGPPARELLASAHLARALARAESSRMAEAEQDFAESLRLAPQNVETYLYRAHWLRRAGNPKEAEAAAAKARELGGSMADLYYNAGVRELKNLRTGEAEQLFSFAADLDPTHVRGWMGVARCAMERGRYAAASEALTRAIELQPEAAELYYNRANAYRAQEKWEEAFGDAFRALDRDPRNPLHYVLRGVIYRQYYKDVENAERDFNQALELDSLLPTAYLERGILFHDMRLLNDAERDLRQALAHRASPEGIIALGRVLRDKGEYDKAVDLYRRALDVYPDPVVRKTLQDELQRTLQTKETDK
jgi:tetratricopeptide (TPR) repeat protein